MSSSTAGYTCHGKRTHSSKGTHSSNASEEAIESRLYLPQSRANGVISPSWEQALLRRERAWQQQTGAVEYPYFPCLRALSKREGLKLVGMSSSESLPFKFIDGRAPTTVSPQHKHQTPHAAVFHSISIRQCRLACAGEPPSPHRSSACDHGRRGVRLQAMTGSSGGADIKNKHTRRGSALYSRTREWESRKAP